MVRGLPLIEPFVPGVTVTVIALVAVVALPHWSITLTFAVQVLPLFLGTLVIAQLVAGVVQLSLPTLRLCDDHTSPVAVAGLTVKLPCAEIDPSVKVMV